MPESLQPSHGPDSEATNSGGGGGNKKRTPTGLNQHFVDVLGWVITAMWAASMILHAAPQVSYEPPSSIHILMMVVAGTAFGTNFIKPKNGGTNGNT